MFQFLTKIDQFGSEQKLQIHPQNPIQKSVLGGIMTVILYGLSFAFFLSELIDWGQNNKLPKITSYRKAIDQAESVLQEGTVLEISYYQWDDGDVDPFDPQNLTFYPVVTKIVDQIQNYTSIPILFEQTIGTNGKTKNKFYLENLQTVSSPSNNEDTNSFTDYRIAISMCNQSQIPSGFRCADEQRNQKYFSQITYLQIIYYSNAYDSKQKDLSKTSKYNLLRINQDSTEFYQIQLQMSNTQTDDGILFNNFKVIKYIKDFAVASFKIGLNQALQTYGSVTPLVVYIALDQIKENVVIEYPKISEILANTGSIISWILQISFFVFKYNDSISMDKTIKDIIKLYYPDFDDLNIQYNIMGKCTKVTLKEKKYDPQKVINLLQKLSKFALKKVNYINVQHEISKLQFAIQQTIGVGCFKQNGEKIETLMDNLGCRIDEGTGDNTQIKILPEQYLQNKLISQEYANIEPQFQMIEYSIDLLSLKKQEILQETKQIQIEQSVYPSSQI